MADGIGVVERSPSGLRASLGTIASRRWRRTAGSMWPLNGMVCGIIPAGVVVITSRGSSN